MRRYSSGQRGETVNLLTSVFEGSNPSRRTKQIPKGIFVLWPGESQLLGFREG